MTSNLKVLALSADYTIKYIQLDLHQAHCRILSNFDNMSFETEDNIVLFEDGLIFIVFHLVRESEKVHNSDLATLIYGNN